MKLKRATLGVGLAVLLAVPSLLVAPGVAASPLTEVFIEDALDVPAGETATVNIDIVTDETAGIAAATVRLEYDAGVVQVTGTSAGDLGMPTSNIDNVAGVTMMTVAYGAEPCPTGTVKFAAVGLEAVGGTGETSPLNITVVSLYDCNVVAVVPDVVTDGTFSITEVPPPATFTPTPTSTPTVTPTPRTPTPSATPSPAATVSPTPTPTPTTGGGLGPGAWAGIGIGAFLVILAAGWLVLRR